MPISHIQKLFVMAAMIAFLISVAGCAYLAMPVASDMHGMHPAHGSDALAAHVAHTRSLTLAIVPALTLLAGLLCLVFVLWSSGTPAAAAPVLSRIISHDPPPFCTRRSSHRLNPRAPPFR